MHALDDEGRVELRVERSPGGVVRIAVRDDGQPLSERDQDRLATEPEQPSLTGQLPRSRGLSLVFCRLVAEAHGGSLTVAAEGTEGTVVTLELQPLRPDGSARTA
jgi:signal transduction histidine kinase